MAAKALAALVLSAAALPAAAVVQVTPCGVTTSGTCYVDSNFSSGCASVGGAVVDHSPSLGCLLPGTGSAQYRMCGGGSCYGVGKTNFTAVCRTVGGFISGAEDSMGATGICTVPDAVTQFQACPFPGNCVINTGFADDCQRLGGGIDGYFAPPPALAECVVRGDMSFVKPCNGSSSGCTFSSSNFTGVCSHLGGFISATIDGLPVCAAPGNVQIVTPCAYSPAPPGCTYVSSNWAAACAKIGGALSDGQSTAGFAQCFVPGER
jgi:hypothetical protein